MSITVPYIDDFHVHLRQGALMRTVTPLLESGGCGLAYVMPNLKPPIKTTAEALHYKQQLQSLSPNTEFLMTLYLNPDLTPEEVHKAAKAGIRELSSRVTTNSDSGIESYTVYYEIFRAMEEAGMVLNLHGEIPSDPSNDICVLNAEERFLEHLAKLHADFPGLKIVLEHATTKAAVDMPVAKFPHDRDALREVVRQGHPRFFLGTDSAPHPRHTKENTATAAAGVFVTPFVLPYLATILDSFGAIDQLEGFSCQFGRMFYGVGSNTLPRQTITLIKCEADSDSRCWFHKKFHLLMTTWCSAP
ncbi:dihydroorotase, homodimeric type [Batrachochytrium salamandrivorans]|nr:dihydroorotase, homodimeric type [Batrachochytrium salamandrivorans]